MKTTAIFVFAMIGEAEPFIKLTQAKPYESDLSGPSLFYCFEHTKQRFAIAVAGTSQRHQCDRIGSVPAALLAYQAMALFDCDWLISAGTCGAVNPDLQVGDVVLIIGAASNYDQRIDISPFKPYGTGDYPIYVPEPWHRASNWFKGVASTGRSLDTSAADVSRLAALTTDVKEMELAAIAQVCDEYGGRCSAFKAVTNATGVEVDAHSEFDLNFTHVSERLATQLWSALELLNID